MTDSRDLTTLANVKAWLNVSSGGDDVLLQRLLTAVSCFIQSWLGRTIGEADYIETRDGTGTRSMILTIFPVASVQNLTIDGRTIPASLSAGCPGYLFNATRLALIGYRFPKRLGNVTIEYTAGYAAAPPEIEQACIAMIAARYRERDRVGLASKGLAGETTQFSLLDMPRDVSSMLWQYRKTIPL